MSESPPQKPPSALGALARSLARRVLEDEVRHRLGELEREPLGYLIKAGMARHRGIKEQGREWTDEDVSEFVEDVPDIVEYAREDKRRRDEDGTA